ncbi:MAG: CGNR zinc finger domain-containing protein [Candidatus Binataceae bacterium]
MTTSHRIGWTRDLILAPRHGLCLDFANTLSWRGSEPRENLHGFKDLLDWCVGADAIPARVAEKMRTWSAAHPTQAADVFSEALAIREIIYKVFHAAASDDAPAEDVLRLLNNNLKRAPLRISVERDAGGFGWRVEATEAAATTLLAPILWSAGDLLVGPQLRRVRQCANERCLWLFHDDSKNGSRRWCSMKFCGNRAKAQRHYLRQKQD